MIIMAVDLGDARTGVACSDESEQFAFPKEVLTEYNPDRRIARLADMAKKFGAGLIVMGYPKNMDGSVGFKAESCAAAAKALEQASGLPVVLWDERCTTVLAHNALNATNTRGKKRKAVVDAVAATLILESYLEYRKKSNAE
jgi:putative Holliday junction resolvase